MLKNLFYKNRRSLEKLKARKCRKNLSKKLTFTTVETIGDGSCFYRAMATARDRMAHNGFEDEEAAVCAMRQKVQVYITENINQYEGGIIFNAMEEGFESTEKKMISYSLARLPDMDCWAGEESMIAYSIMNNLTIRIKDCPLKKWDDKELL
jgi:hypothetical protein